MAINPLQAPINYMGSQINLSEQFSKLFQCLKLPDNEEFRVRRMREVLREEIRPHSPHQQRPPKVLGDLSDLQQGESS